MTSSDKTRQKLVDSMRRTKAAAVPQGDSVAGEAGQKPASTSTGPARQKTTRTPAKKSRKTPENTSRSHADPYQGGRRVWPD